MRRPRGRHSGRVSIGQIVGVLLLVVAGYFGFKYLPVLQHKWSIAESARKVAARMMVDFDDRKLQEEMREEVKQNTGIEIGYMSELHLSRESGGRKTVSVSWNEQIEHIGGKVHVLEMSVTEYVEPGAYKLKNAQ